MNITVNKNISSPPREEIARPLQKTSAFDRQFGAWGNVNAVHSDDNTVDVTTSFGVFLSRVPVASKEWVIFGEDVSKDINSGERDLPPVNARVFVFMPTFSFTDCFVAPFSGFITIDRNASSPFLDDNREKIKERITPSGWHITNDYVTGSHKSISPDGKTSFEIDYGTEEEKKEGNSELHFKLFDEVTIDHVEGDSCTIKVFDTELVIKQGEVKIKPKETTIEIDGNAKVEATGNVDIKGVNVTVDASAMLTLKTGDAASFVPNIMPQCPLGPVHGGKLAGIIKLCGA